MPLAGLRHLLQVFFRRMGGDEFWKAVWSDAI